MAEQNNYYTAAAMQDKKLSDLTLNEDFLTDAVAFLKSDRLQYTDDDLKEMSASDVTDKVLEHMRYQTVNERTMYKDYYFIADESTPDNEREAFSRLMFAFDNAKGEGMFDRGGEKLQDYAGAVLSSPTTMIAGAAGLFTAGTGAVAVKAGAELLKAGGKAASVGMLRKAAIESIKKASITAAADGSIAAATDLANQRIRQIGGKTIGEERDISLGQAAVSGVIGAAPGLAMYGAGRLVSNRASKKLLEAGQMGEEAMLARRSAGKEAAVKTSTRAKKTEDGEALLGYVSNTLLRAIDPRMVEKGKIVREDIFSSDLPDGLIGGFDVDTIQRIAAAGYEVAEQMGVTGAQVRDGKRITEVIADSIRDGDGIAMDTIDVVREKYNLSREQLSSAYAAEVSDAARILRSSRTARDEAYANKIDSLYEQGMSPVTKDEMKVMQEAAQSRTSVTINNLKVLENSRRMLMTSQPATTMRNNIFSVAMTGIDIIDQLNTSVVRTVRPNAEAPPNFKGSIDTFKYLSSDNYIAESLVNLLNESAPKRMQKVFYDAAIAEEALTRPGDFSISKPVTSTVNGLAKLGTSLNVLNTMSDRVVKRAVIAGTINRKLKELGNEELGTSVMDMMRKGRTQDLPDDILKEALDESLVFTFQRPFGGKDASYLNKAAQKTIRIIHDFGFTLAIPFPRYLASQAKFVSDYTGLTVLRRLGTPGRRIEDAEFGKAMTGAMGIGGLFHIYKNKVQDEGETDWNEVKDPLNNRTYNAQSALGPLTTHAYIIDQFARWYEGMPMKTTKQIREDLSEIIGASEFRPDSGFVDAINKVVDGQGMDKLQKVLVDTAVPFTYPFATIKDFYGQFDPSSSFIPNLQDATYASQSILLDLDSPYSMYQRLTRQFPDFNTKQMARTFNEMFGTDIKEDGIISYLQFAASSTRTQFQTQYGKEIRKDDLEYDAVRMNIFGNSPIRIADPLDKQLTGFMGRQSKTALEREITRLQMDPFKLYNPYREKNVLLETAFQQFAQGRMASQMKTYLDSPRYKAIEDVEEKRKALKGMFDSLSNNYRATVKDIIVSFAESGPKERNDYKVYIKAEYLKLSDEDLRTAEKQWKGIRGEASEREDRVFEKKDMSIDDTVEYTKNRKDFTEEEKSTYITNLYRIILEEVKLENRQSDATNKAIAEGLATGVIQ